MSFGYSVLGFGADATHTVSASGGFSLSDTTDVAAFSNPFANGDTITVTNSASGHSTCTFSFLDSSTGLTLGTLSDLSGGAPDILAWESDSSLTGSPADIAESSNQVTDLVGTWYFKINGRLSTGQYATGKTITVTQTVDSSIVTTVTFTVA